jgi:hypothetical protein
VPAPKAVFPAIVGPLESQVEHGGTRAQYAHVVADCYARDYEQIFGALPVLSLVPRFAGPVADREAALTWSALSSAQRDDRGRLTGATALLSDEFNCRSQWSDARERCAELEFIVTGEHTLDRPYKVPSLRNVAERAPYMTRGSSRRSPRCSITTTVRLPQRRATANYGRCG